MIPFNIAAFASGLDPDAKAFIDYVGSMNSTYQTAYNNLVKSLKSAGLWGKGIVGYTNAPVKDDSKTQSNLFDPGGLKDGVLKGSSSTGVKNAMASPYMNELILEGVTNGNGYVQMSVNPSVDFPIGVTILEVSTTPYVAENTFDFGSFKNPSETFSFQHRNNLSLMNGQMFSNSGNSFVSGSNSTTEFDLFLYRTNVTTITESRKNGVSIDLNLGVNAGIAPNNDIIWGGLTNPSQTTPWLKRSKRASCFFIFNFTDDTETSALEGIISQFLEEMTRPCTLNSTNWERQWVWTGNSYSRYWNQQFFRFIQFNRNPAYEKYTNLAVNGQTTTQILNNIADFNSLYDAGLDFNNGGIWEITNDLFFGTSVAAALQNLKDVYSAVAGYGYDEWFCGSCIARSASGNTGGLSKTDFYLAIDAVNEGVLANPNDYGTSIINFQNPNLWTPRSNYGSDADFVTAIDDILANTLYWETDKTHPSEIGMELASNEANLVIGS